LILVYIYDGSFEGLLTSVYYAYYSKDKPEEIISCSDFVYNMLYNCRHIETERDKADKVLTAISMKISESALHNIFYVFLSAVPGSDTLIYKYIRLGFKLGSKVDLHLHDDIVHEVHKICRKVTLETHQMLGFVRFKDVGNNIFYSCIEPDHNIVALLAPHFKARLSDQRWIIHDIRRELAVMYNGLEWITTYFTREEGKKLTTAADTYYEVLWREYFDSMPIEERINPKQQSRMMPRRYWKHLTEFQNR
jgi:probable DNA metabolism protein